jgi:hypothetical protein
LEKGIINSLRSIAELGTGTIEHDVFAEASIKLLKILINLFDL